MNNTNQVSELFKESREKTDKLLETMSVYELVDHALNMSKECIEKEDYKESMFWDLVKAYAGGNYFEINGIKMVTSIRLLSKIPLRMYYQKLE